jgi:hypothetical protein
MRALHSKIPKSQVQSTSKAKSRQSLISKVTSNPQVQYEVEIKLGELDF